jgi:hypothetical protein
LSFLNGLAVVFFLFFFPLATYVDGLCSYVQYEKRCGERGVRRRRRGRGREVRGERCTAGKQAVCK